MSKLRGDRGKLEPDRCLKCSLNFKIKVRTTLHSSSRIPRVLFCGHAMCNVCIEKGIQDFDKYVWWLKYYLIFSAISGNFPVICPICGKQGPSDAKIDNFPLSFHTLGRRMFYSSDEDDASSLASYSSVTTTTPDSLSESSKVSEFLAVVNYNFLMQKLSSIPAFHNKSTFIRLDKLFVSSSVTSKWKSKMFHKDFLAILLLESK